MYFLKGEDQICSALYAAGWIQDYVLVSRDDSQIIWTELGTARIKDFFAEVEKVYRITSDRQRRSVRSFAVYHGIVQNTVRDRIYSMTTQELESRPLRIIACDAKGDMEDYRSDPGNPEDAVDFIERADALGKEVIIVLPKGYYFPLGAKGYLKGRPRPL